MRRRAALWSFLFLPLAIVSGLILIVVNSDGDGAQAASYDVSWGSHVTPATMAPGASAAVTLSFTNTGTLTWNNSGLNPVRVAYHWRSGACPGGSTAIWEGVRSALPSDLATGQGATNLVAQVVAPAAQGSYCLVYDLVKEGVTWFSSQGASTLAVDVTVTAGAPVAYGVTWGTHTTPPSFAPGATMGVTLSFTNSGSQTWDNGGANPVRLSYHWKTGNCPGNTTVVKDGLRTLLPSSVAPGQSVTNLSAQVMAPSSPGSYCLLYDLVKEGVTWFSSQGANMLAVNVTVTGGSPPYGVSWGTHSTPASMAPATATAVTVSFTNTGTLTWETGGANPVRFAYHWKNGACPGGTIAIWDGVRTVLPSSVAAGQGVTNLAAQVMTPASAGTYCLIYDLVKEGLTWFSAQGAATLSTTVVVGNVTQTITFDDKSGQNQALSGQYPTAVLDWGSSTWWHSAPFGLLTTKNFTFNGPSISTGTITLVTPRAVLSLDAYNGGAASSTVTLQCPGQPNKQVSVGAGQLQTVATSWTGTCSSLTISSSNGWDTNFDNLVLLGSGPAQSPTPTPTPAGPNPTPTPTPTPSPVAWAFEETFDGNPASPQPFVTNQRWTVESTAGDGQTCVNDDCTQLTYVPVMAGHGSDCSAPPAMHEVTSDPEAMFICRDHMMTTVHAGYGISNFTTKQEFDFAGRTGVIEFDVNLYSGGREWWALYLVPKGDDQPEFALFDEAGVGPQPERGLQFSYIAGAPTVRYFENGEVVYRRDDTWLRHEACDCLASEPGHDDPKVRFTFRIEVSETGWRWLIKSKRLPGTWWEVATWDSHTWPSELDFSRVVLHFEHYSYNPTKDGIDQPHMTFHWDNIRFDGPVIAAAATGEDYAPAGATASVAWPAGLASSRFVGLSEVWQSSLPSDWAAIGNSRSWLQAASLGFSGARPTQLASNWPAWQETLSASASGNDGEAASGFSWLCQ